MNNTQIPEIVEELNATFKGEPWYGISLMEKLNQITVEEAVASVPDYPKTIVKFVKHLLAWREFVIKKLEGEALFKIEMNTESDWPAVEIKSDSDWKNLLSELEASQRKILELLAHLSDDLLWANVPGENYNYRYMLRGLIEHDTYHLGQISLLHSILKDS
ncbi:DinB family protein [Cytophaga sp. FL35]|uniref:DinB family protein n=1 Tax=Cytophaga sp. FL35 TaxID=1904456 RepID=UPI0016536239|nr:DinB family protein [Cytophaga sp. FL35]MBC6997226.1 DinB family protein [Cytophaga sp. FL35]